MNSSKLPVMEPYRGGLRETALFAHDAKMLKDTKQVAKVEPGGYAGVPLGKSRPKTSSKKSGKLIRHRAKGKPEKSLGAYVKKGVEHGARLAWDWAWRRMFGGAAARVTALNKQLNAARRSDFISVKSDGKDVKVEKSDTTKLLEVDLSMIRTSIARSFHHEAVKITLTVPFTLTSTVTSGVVNTVVSIRPSFSGEFSSLASLFEEYRCIGGVVHFMNYLRAPYLIGTTAATLNGAMLGLCFDTSNAVLTSLSSVTEYEQHLTVLNGAQSGSPLVQMHAPHRFEFKIPGGIELGGTAYNSNTWVPTSVSAIDFGYLKSYSVGTEVAALDSVIGYTRLHCEFRMRE